jgi:hypothetical protein
MPVTQDFRQRSPHQIGLGQAKPPAVEQAQRLVVRTLSFSAVAFICAGAWLLTQEQSLIPPEVAPLLGLALIFVAVTNVLLARFLKRFWTRKQG